MTRAKLPSLPMTALAVVAVVSSFAVGLRTAGDVSTVQHTEASDEVLEGDMNGDGKTDASDVIAILEIAQGYEAATPSQLLADPNGDGAITVEDAMQLLRDIGNL